MVKTVLHELVKLRGTAIKGHLSMVPIDAEPQPIILAYIDLNLQVELAKPPLPTSFFVQPFFLAKQHCSVVVDPCSR
jgi:cytoskeleton-associated protein 5